MYHIWQFNISRNALTLLKAKPVNRWNQSDEPAVWQTRSAAHKWGAQRFDSAGFMVMQCPGPGLCAMTDHLDEAETEEWAEYALETSA